MTNYSKMRDLLIANGMQEKISKLFIKKFKIDEEVFKCSEKEREWAMSKGFFPSRIDLFSLTEDNYKHYLPDYADFMLHPYNNHFVIWINDKLSLKYTLGGDFADIMPEYYLYIENNGEFTYLGDTPATIAKDKDFLINLLKEKKVLIIKPNSSKSGGEGVMKVEWVDGQIRINNRELLSKEEFMARTANLGNNIVTEYANQHPELKKIWPEAECTLRINMAKLPHVQFYSEPKWKCLVSYARFGTSTSGITSNMSLGGIAVGFDFETGKFNNFGHRFRQFCPDGQCHIYEHPDTHIAWGDISLPNCDYLRDTIYKVCSHYGSLSHLGFDVIITEKGFVLCEINSKPALNYDQLICGPLLLPEDTRQYFMNKGLDKLDLSKFYQIYKECQE